MSEKHTSFIRRNFIKGILSYKDSPFKTPASSASAKWTIAGEQLRESTKEEQEA